MSDFQQLGWHLHASAYKGDKLKRNIMINNYPEGGLKITDIASFNKSVRATWIQKYLDPGNQSKWIEATLTQNLNEMEAKGY